jgi:hypothetical protein
MFSGIWRLFGQVFAFLLLFVVPGLSVSSSEGKTLHVGQKAKAGIAGGE